MSNIYRFEFDGFSLMFVCELIGKTLNDYRTDKDDEDSDIDDDLLEADIKEQVEVESFLDNMGGIY